MTYQEATAKVQDLFFEIKSKDPFKIFDKNVNFIGLIVLPSDMQEMDFLKCCTEFDYHQGSFQYILENKLTHKDLSIRACYLESGDKMCISLETFLKNLSN